MAKIIVKHPITICAITFGLVIASGYLKLMNVILSDQLINITFATSIISLIYALVRLKKSSKVID